MDFFIFYFYNLGYENAPINYIWHSYQKKKSDIQPPQNEKQKTKQKRKGGPMEEACAFLYLQAIQVNSRLHSFGKLSIPFPKRCL